MPDGVKGVGLFIIFVEVFVTVADAVRVKVGVMVLVAVPVKVPVAVRVYVEVMVLVAVRVKVGVMVTVAATQPASDIVVETNVTMSRLDAPSAISEVSVIVLYPASRFTDVFTVFQVVHAPVFKKSRLATCTLPFTATDIFLLFTLPLANRKDSVTACAEAEFSEKVMAEPIALSRFAYPAPVKPALVLSKMPFMEHGYSSCISL